MKHAVLAMHALIQGGLMDRARWVDMPPWSEADYKGVSLVLLWVVDTSTTLCSRHLPCQCTPLGYNLGSDVGGQI